MRCRFFSQYRQISSDINDTSERKKAERSRNVITDIDEDYANKRETRRFIEQQLAKQNCYKEGELTKRLSQAKIDIWYLSVLSGNDITKHKAIRNCSYAEAMKMLELIINSL